MKIKLSQNAFVRNYGPYTYLFNQVNDADFLTSDSKVFFDFISREYQDIDIIIGKIANIFNIEPSEIKNDYFELIDQLKNAGIIVDDFQSDDEFNYKTKQDDSVWGKYTNEERAEAGEFSEGSPRRHLFDYFCTNPTPFVLKIDLTQRCTERCIHCYVPNYNTPFLPLEKIKEVLTEAHEMGSLDLTFSGGECMMHPQFAEILRFAREKDYMITILSNLTLCNDEKIALLKEICPRFIQVSLYGSTAEIHDRITQRPGSYAETTKAIEKLLAANIPVQFNCPILKENYRDINNIKKLESLFGIKGNYNIDIIGKADGDLTNMSHGLSSDEIQEYFKLVAYEPKHVPQLKRKPDDYVCKIMGFSRINLHSEGDYYPCNGAYNLKLGNCYKQTLKDVWQKSDLLNKLRNLRMKDFPKCLSCCKQGACMICPAHFFAETGSLFTPSENNCLLTSLKAKAE